MKRLHIQQFLVGLLLLTAWAQSPVTQAANVADFADFSLTDSSGGVFMPGRLYIPPVAISNPASPRPLILFLHGGGEGGFDNVSQVNANIDNLLTAAKSRGAFLYAPQTPVGWNNQTITNDVISMIAEAIATQNVDPNRIYVTGLSLGGGGTWNMLSRYPNQFAAGVPVCGVSPDSDFDLAAVVHQSVFAFHARNDVTVPVGITRNQIAQLLAADTQPIPAFPTSSDWFLSNSDLPSHQALLATIGHSRSVVNYSIAGSGLDLAYFEYATGGHAIFNTVYNTPQMYDWMFSHSLAVPEPSLVSLAACLLATLVSCYGNSRRK